jgi:hypothetical protein
MMALLFLSSYSPLFLLLGLRSYGKSDAIFGLACVALGLSIIGLALFAFAAATRSSEEHRLLSVEPSDGDVAAYAATYLLPFLAIFGAGWRDVLALGLFVVFIGILYVNSQMIFVNPVLAVMGYHLYRVQTTTAPAQSPPSSRSPSRWLVCKAHDLRPQDRVVVREMGAGSLFAFPSDNA